MNKLLDKLLFLILCLVFYFLVVSQEYSVVPVIIAISISGLNSYIEHMAFRIATLCAFVIACLFYPDLLLFLPLICYDVFGTRVSWLGLFAFLPIAANFSRVPLMSSVLTALFVALAWFMKRRSMHLESLKSEYITLQDSAKELLLRLEQKNKDLLDKQDYEINVATLNERNRIAREIHDNVGHLLSSSILQIGALMAICKDETLRGSLDTLKETLSKGMDSIRSSIHNLHDQSIDLFGELDSLVKGFAFCSISLEYDVEGSPESSVKYAFIAIVKEALSNIIKHSNATQVRVIVREHPGFYQLVVKDNGTKRDTQNNSPTSASGIGLQNIKSRVEALRGVVTINTENGFVVFASVPKE